MLASRVLSTDLQAELGIVGATLRHDGQFLRFRLDPGNLFERSGLLRDNLDGSYNLGISQRYRPHETGICVSAATASIVDLPGRLRAAVEFARQRDAYLPHWLETRRRETPEWSREFSVSQIRDATAAAAARARESAAVIYVAAGQGRVTCANNPPGAGEFFSVTPGGDWSLHRGTATRPLTVPDGRKSADARQVAARDVPTAGPAGTPQSKTAAARPGPGRRRPARGR